MSLIRKILWFALFVVATFGFEVVFEHGTTNFQKNAQLEFALLKKFYNTSVKREKDQSDKIGQ